MGNMDAVAVCAALIVIAGAVLAVRHTSGRHRAARAPSGTRSDLVGYIAVAMLSALASVVSYAASLPAGTLLATMLANASMVFCPAMAWAGLRRVNGRSAWDIVPAAGVSATAAALTGVTPWDGAVARVAAVTLFCFAAFLETRRMPLRGLSGARIVAATMLGYGAYTAARLVGALILGRSSPVWIALFSPRPAAVLGLAALIALSLAVALMSRDLRGAPARRQGRRAAQAEAARMLRDGGTLSAWTLQTIDHDLIRAAHGHDRADGITAAMEAAVMQVLPGAVITRAPDGGVMALLPAHAAPPGAETRIRRAFEGLSPRIGQGDVPLLDCTCRTIRGVPELTRLLARRASARRQPAVPFG